jgi:hypothetical protein
VAHAPRIYAEVFTSSDELLPRVIVSNYASQYGSGTQHGDLLGDVGSAAETILHLASMYDGDRRFG